MKMDVRYSRKGRSAFDKTQDRGRRPATQKAFRDLVQKERHQMDEVPLQVRRLAALSVPLSFGAAAAKLVVLALDPPVIGLRAGVGAV